MNSFLKRFLLLTLCSGFYYYFSRNSVELWFGFNVRQVHLSTNDLYLKQGIGIQPSADYIPTYSVCTPLSWTQSTGAEAKRGYLHSGFFILKLSSRHAMRAV